MVHPLCLLNRLKKKKDFSNYTKNMSAPIPIFIYKRIIFDFMKALFLSRDLILQYYVTHSLPWLDWLDGNSFVYMCKVMKNVF